MEIASNAETSKKTTPASNNAYPSVEENIDTLAQKKSRPKKQVKNMNNRFLHLPEDVPPSLPLCDVSLVGEEEQKRLLFGEIAFGSESLDDECKADQTAKREKRTPKHLKQYNDAERHWNRSGQLPKSFFPIFGGNLIFYKFSTKFHAKFWLDLAHYEKILLYLYWANNRNCNPLGVKKRLLKFFLIIVELQIL